MAITPLPTPPSRDDPANFAARGDAFLGALPDFATELNDALPTINDAIPASEIAVALVNYKGDYNSATTYLVGQSVTYNDVRFLSKKTNLNITPVDGNDWYELAAGVETTVRSILNQSSAITLLSSDGGGYLLVSGTDVINLNLPNATTLVGRTFVIKNIGSFAMLVYDAAGNYLFPIAPSTAVAIWASDIATSAGQWAIQTIPPDFITASSQIAVYGQGVGYAKNCVAKISTSQQIFGFYRQVDSTGTKPYAMIVTQSGGTLTFGASYLIADEEASSVTVSMCTPTTGVMSWMGVGSIRACVITVSGTTITAGTPITIFNSAIYGNNKTEGASATTAFLTYHQTSVIIQGVALSISGTTLTAGTPVRLNTGRDSDGQDYFLGIGSATFGNICHTTTGNELFGTGFTISGTTVTAGTPTALNGGTAIGNSFVYGCALSASKFAIMYYDGALSDMKIRCVNWSGTTPTSATAQSFFTPANVSYSFQIGAMSATSGVIAYGKGGGVVYLKGWTLSTNTFTFGTEFSGPTTITNSYQFNNLVGFSAPDFGTPATATYMSHYQYEIGSNMQTLTLSGTTVSQTSTRYMVSASNTIPHLRSPKSMCSLSTTRALSLIGIIGDGPSQFGFGVVLQDCSTATPTVLQTLFIGTTKSPTLYSITALSATQALVTFTSSTGTQEAQVITMTGNTIALGTQLQVSSSTTCIDTTVTRLSATTAICAWRNATSENKAVVLTVSGTSITAGTANTFNTATVTYPFIEGLSATTALVVYNQGGATKANVFTVSGTTITAGPQQGFEIGEVDYNYLSALSSTKCMFGTGAGSAGSSACVAVLTITGNIVTAGVASYLTYTFQGFKMACLTSKSGILINGSTATSRSFVISNNAVSMGQAQPCRAKTIAALQTPATATPSASRVIVEGDTGFDLVHNTIYSSSGALN